MMGPGSSHSPVWRIPRSGRRWILAILAIICVGLVGGTLVASWYTDSVTAGAGTSTVNYQLWNTCTVTGPTGTVTWVTPCYAPGNSGVSNILTASQWLEVAALVMGLVAFGFALIALVGYSVSRHQPRVIFVMLMLSFVVAIAGPIWMAVQFPSALATSGCTAPAPCSSFWGMGTTALMTPGSSTVTGPGVWGPGIGWYVAIAASILFLLGAVIANTWPARQLGDVPAWAMGPPPAIVPEPVMAPAPSMGSPGPAAMPAPSASPAAMPAPAATPSGMNCPKCGRPATYIPQYARYYCYNCQQYV